MMLLLGVTPLTAIAQSTQTIAVCLNTNEVFFQAKSVDFDLINDANPAAGGKASTKPLFSDLTIEKEFDLTSPKLFIEAAKGTVWKAVDVVVYPGSVSFEVPLCHVPGEESIMSVTLRDAIISEMASRADVEQGTIQSVSFRFSQICVSNQVGVNVLCWDIPKNKQF